MHGKIDLNYLKTSLPILEKGLKEKYARLTSIFKEIISSETENEAFFRSPLDYLEEHEALPKLAIAKGNELPLIQGEVLAQTVRKARELYKAGKLELNIIEADPEYKTKTKTALQWENITLDKDIWREKHKGVLWHFEQDTKGASVLRIDGRLIGPLADPALFEELRVGLESELKKEKRGE